ncbi:carbohydrate kinase family protein [Diaminobutyricibacter sp. McL0618]|uniref:carbohydrate kinase family protein n=1 Tax=Leifsonia sp. McL0618 TaxID=3415677 RepID=UPI003CED38A5
MPATILDPRAGWPCVSIGSYIFDILGRPVDSLPKGQTTQLIDEIKVTVAGSAGGTAVNMSRLGMTVSAVGVVGEDTAGDFVLRKLHEEGVLTGSMRRTSQVQTAASILPIDSSGQRPAYHVIGANRLLELSDVPEQALRSSDIVHVGGMTALPGLDGEPMAELLSDAGRWGAFRTLDCLGIKRDDALDLATIVLPHVDAFFPNDAEAMRLTGEPDPFRAAQRLVALGAGCVYVTCGERGAIVATAAGIETVPAFSATPVDSTGCGDAFVSGVMLGMLRGESPVEAARVGAAAAALTVAGLGSDAGELSPEKVDAYRTSAAELAYELQPA